MVEGAQPLSAIWIRRVQAHKKEIIKIILRTAFKGKSPEEREFAMAQHHHYYLLLAFWQVWRMGAHCSLCKALGVSALGWDSGNLVLKPGSDRGKISWDLQVWGAIQLQSTLSNMFKSVQRLDPNRSPRHLYSGIAMSASCHWKGRQEG